MNLLAMATSDAERSTRARVARAIGEDGPVTASDLARTLGLTPAAVRRHLDAMLADGLIAERTPPVLHRRPGRPAKAFVLSTAGHAAMTNTYDDVAVSALRFLAARQGPEAVREFAAERVASLERRYASRVGSAGKTPQDRAQALAEALSADGYAATTRPVGGGTRAPAVQLCQGHCPVQHVAAQFPELCEAEAAAFSRLLGVHVQRLATLAQGAHVCTTHVPVPLSSSRPDDAPPRTEAEDAADVEDVGPLRMDLAANTRAANTRAANTQAANTQAANTRAANTQAANTDERLSDGRPEGPADDH